jgi:hypothetical protein
MIPHTQPEEVRIKYDERLMEADEHRLARLVGEGPIRHRRGWHALVAPIPAHKVARAGNRARRTGAC